MRKLYFLKWKFYLPKKLGKWIFFRVLFSHKEARIWFSLYACDRGITDRWPIVCLRLSRVHQSIRLRCFKSSAAHFVRHEYRLVQRMLPHTFHSFAVNDSVIGSFPPPSAVGFSFSSKVPLRFQTQSSSRDRPTFKQLKIHFLST